MEIYLYKPGLRGVTKSFGNKESFNSIKRTCIDNVYKGKDN